MDHTYHTWPYRHDSLPRRNPSHHKSRVYHRATHVKRPIASSYLRLTATNVINAVMPHYDVPTRVSPDSRARGSEKSQIRSQRQVCFATGKEPWIWRPACKSSMWAGQDRIGRGPPGGWEKPGHCFPVRDLVTRDLLTASCVVTDFFLACSSGFHQRGVWLVLPCFDVLWLWCNLLDSRRVREVGEMCGCRNGSILARHPAY